MPDDTPEQTQGETSQPKVKKSPTFVRDRQSAVGIGGLGAGKRARQRKRMHGEETVFSKGEKGMTSKNIRTSAGHSAR